VRPSLDQLNLVSLALPVAGEAERNLHIYLPCASSFDTFFKVFLRTLPQPLKKLVNCYFMLSHCC
jgi:hypothetical protein